MDFLKRLKTLTQRETSAKLLGALSYCSEKHVFYCEGNTLGVCWSASLLNGMDAQTYAKFRSLLTKDYPPNSILSFHLISSNVIENYVNLFKRKALDIKLHEHLNQTQKDTLKSWVENRSEFILSGQKNPLLKSNETLVNNKDLVICLQIPCGNPPRDEDFEKIDSMALAVEEGLNAISMEPSRMKVNQYIRMIDGLLNMGDRSSKKYNEEKLIREQIVDYETEIEVERDLLVVNDRYIKSLSVKDYPDQVFPGMLNVLLGDPRGQGQQIRDAYMMSSIVHFPDKVKKRQQIDKASKIINYQRSGPWARMEPKIEAKGEGFDVLSKSIIDGAVPIEIWMNIQIFSDSKNQAQKMASGIRTMYSAYGFEIYEDKMVCLPAFLASLPMNINYNIVEPMCRFSTMTDEQGGALLPVMGDWKGPGPEGSNLFVGRRGQVMLWDLWDSPAGKNCTIAAETGAGKSFLANDVALGNLAKGAYVRIIDQGESYKNICTTLDGQFIAFDENSNVCLNPFSRVKDIDDELESLTAILALMAAPDHGIDDFQSRVLSAAILETHHALGNEMSVTDVAATLTTQAREKSDKRYEDLAIMLTNFTRHGSYGHYFEGRCNLNYDNALVILELSHLMNKGELQKVALLLLIINIEREFYHSIDESIPKILIVDEAWALLEDAMVAKFLEGMYRRIRKHNGAAIFITQSIADLNAHKAGMAIAKNSAHTLILKQLPIAIEQIKNDKSLKLSEYGYSMLETVKTVKGQYSEIYFITPGGEGVGRLIVDRFTQLLYSTDPVEKGKIKKMVSSGYTVSEAINEVIRQEQQRRAA